jgi:hypothetical protein
VRSLAPGERLAGAYGYGRPLSSRLQASNIDIVSLECHNARVPMDLIELICGKLSALRAGTEMVRRELVA